MTSELTPRETEIVILIAHGFTRKEMASHLSLSPSTIAMHTAHIHEKLGLRNVGQVVRYALLTGLVKLGEAVL